MQLLFLGLLLFIHSFAALAAFDSNQLKPSANLEILRITPSGDNVQPGKQIVIQFNQPVIPIGRMDRESSEIPIIITPSIPCEWRWINTSALACNLPDRNPLQESTEYKMEIKPGIKTEGGITIANTYNHSFITERPAIRYNQFSQWQAPGHPVLKLFFNQPVYSESVAQHVFFSIGENNKRINLKVSPDPQDKVKPTSVNANPEKTSKNNIDDKETAQNQARRIWLVEPIKELPLDTHVVVKLEAGLASALGSEKSITADNIVEFDTYPEFTFLGVRCLSNNNQQIDIPVGQPQNDKCNPLRPITLSFSAPVNEYLAQKVIKVTPSIGWDKNAEEAISQNSNNNYMLKYALSQANEKGRIYNISLPYGLKAAQEYELQSRIGTMNIFERIWYKIKSWFKPAPELEVRDLFGRKLKNTISYKFSTDHRNPNFVLDYTDAVLEKDVDSEVPLYVNNLKSYSFNYNRLTTKTSEHGLALHKEIPAVKDIQFAVPLGVREMLNGKTGAVYGELITDPVVEKGNKSYLFAQVTPYQVHLKLGHFNSVAWVTDMATGEPVAGANVSFYKDIITKLIVNNDAQVKAITDKSGIAILPGTETLDPDLAITRGYGNNNDLQYFLRVEKGEDMALMPISYSFIINSYRASGSESVYPTNRYRYGHMRAWGTTAQGIYRAGDSVQYKIYVRNQNNNSFMSAPSDGYNLELIDPTGKVAGSVKDIKLSEFSATSGEFAIPKEAPIGWYVFRFSHGDCKSNGENQGYINNINDQEYESEESGSVASQNQKCSSWIPMRVLISDFTPSPFKVTNQLNGEVFHSGDKVEVTTRAELHSGGAYTDSPARITAILESTPFTSKNPQAKDFKFDSYKYEAPSQQIFQNIDKVNDKGELSLDFSMGTPKIVYGKLRVEGAVSDDRGKYVSNQAIADYAGVNRLVGLSSEWLYTIGKPAQFKYIVTDEHGNPATGTDVNIVIEYEATTAARVKGAGNAYLTEYNTKWEPAAKCNGISNNDALVCSFTPSKAGLYRATANIKDTKGNVHSTSVSTYAAGKDFVVWDGNNDNNLTIIPENTSYKVGDTAKYLIKNPYPGAKALITVERYGVLDHFVQTLDGSTPVIELKIKPDYLPGFYLSVVVISPRVEKPLGEGRVDLGKPTFNMGYITVPITDQYKEMLITAKTDNEVYKPRDKVTVKLHAEPRFKDKKEPIEIAVAVLDESVFDLISGGKKYFDPYHGFYELESLDLRNYSLLTGLIGRQKFEKKGANPGGDGGADLSMRSIFKFVSYWNPAIKTDENGNATVSFKAPDNLTGWRVLAIATTPTDRFGLGDANFKVNRPTEVRQVMPNQVMEGDIFDAGFSVMNRTDKTRTINVSIHADGNLDTKITQVAFKKTITLEAYKRTTVLMPIKTAAIEDTNKPGKLHFTITAEDDFDADGMAYEVPVNKPNNLEVAANYGTTIQDKIEEPISFPKEMLTTVGGISVVASPTVIGNVAGAFSYMRDYPYICWEQNLTKGVMAAHYKNLKAYLPASLKWENSDALPQEMLNKASSFQASNGGMSYFIAKDEYVDPYLSAYTAIAFNWLRKGGYQIPEQVENKLHTYLSNILKNDAVPDFYSDGMKSTVRAVALAALAERGKADLSDLERYKPYTDKMSLFGKSYFLQASLAINGGEKYAPEIAKMILSYSNQTGGQFRFSESWDDGYARILASPLRENCAVLDSLTAYGERASGTELVGDIPFKLVSTITQDRKSRDRWENTQENMFCMNALVNYAKVYEKDKPNMKVTASMDGSNFGKATFKDVKDSSVTMERHAKEGDAGKTASVIIERNGTGRLYYSTILSYSLPPEKSKPANAGIEIHREYSVERDGKWEVLKSAAEIKRGELVRVDLYVSVPAARNFVVVDDPVPGGLEPVSRNMATSSVVDAKKGEFKAAAGAFWFKFSDWIDFGISRWSFYHQELRHDSVRYYSDYLPAGNYHLSYVAQSIATGTFSALPAMASEMYNPDVYGKTNALSLKVNEQ